MASRNRIVIVGAGIAGLTVAEQLRAEGFDGALDLIGEETHLPYSRPPLSKQVLLDGWPESEITLKSLNELNDLDINLIQGAEALSLDTKARQLKTNVGIFAFDFLVIATGNKVKTLHQFPDVLSLRTIEDSIYIRDALAKANNVLVIGAGVLGSEIASAAKALGANVGLAARSDKLTFGSLGETLSTELVELHEKNNVAIHFNSNILDIESNGQNRKVLLSNGNAIESDLVISAIGSSPSVDWLEGSQLNISNGVVCDANGSAAPGVYAIGDVAAWPDPFTGIPVRTEHQSNAIEQAISVANHIIYGTAAKSPIPFFWSEVHGARIKAYGWFNQPTLSREVQQDSDGFLITNSKNNVTRGIVGWNASPKAFNKSRALVDQSVV